MAYEAFGKLPDGMFFKHRNKIWSKIPAINSEGKFYNAYSDKEDDPENATVIYVDEATLVNLETGVSEDVQAKLLKLFAKPNM